MLHLHNGYIYRGIYAVKVKYLPPFRFLFFIYVQRLHNREATAFVADPVHVYDMRLSYTSLTIIAIFIFNI